MPLVLKPNKGEVSFDFQKMKWREIILPLGKIFVPAIHLGGASVGIGDFLTQLLVFVFNFVDSLLFTLVRNPTPPGYHRCYMMLPLTMVEHPPPVGLWERGKLGATVETGSRAEESRGCVWRGGGSGGWETGPLWDIDKVHLQMARTNTCSLLNFKMWCVCAAGGLVSTVGFTGEEGKREMLYHRHPLGSLRDSAHILHNDTD